MRDKIITVVIISFLALTLFGCSYPRPNEIPDDAYVQIVYKYEGSIRKELRLYYPEESEYYDLYVSENVYTKTKVGTWVKLEELKEKVSLDE